MQNSQSIRRRILATATALLLAGGTALLLPPAPAQADSLLAQGGVSVDSSASLVTCGGLDDDVAVFSVASSGTQTKSVSVDGTVTDSNDVADVSEWSSSISAKITARAGNDPSLSIAGQVAASVDAVQGDSSDCAVSADAGFSAIGLVDLDTSGWLDLSFVHPKGSTLVFEITDSVTMQLLYQEFDQSAARSSIWVGSGTYQVQVQVQAETDDDSTTPAPSSISGAANFSVSYRAAGTATGAAAGPGKSLLTLGDGVNCTDHQVLGIFTKKAGSLTSATFLVNGKKKRSVSNPSPGDAIVLDTGPPTASTKVQVVMQKGSKKLTVSRSYLACE